MRFHNYVKKEPYIGYEAPERRKDHDKSRPCVIIIDQFSQDQKKSYGSFGKKNSFNILH